MERIVLLTGLQDISFFRIAILPSTMSVTTTALIMLMCSSSTAIICERDEFYEALLEKESNKIDCEGQCRIAVIFCMC